LHTADIGAGQLQRVRLTGGHKNILKKNLFVS
jgi:hypothetical protein